ncbi:MAG: TetR/AcrR family transcriptional regulator [Desulfatibacillaceae bacterium]
MSPKIVDKQQKKSDIINATLELLAQKGFAKTSIAQVAKAADIGKGTIYEYFASKDDLVVAAFEARVVQLAGETALAVSHVDNPLERLRRFVRMVTTAFVHDHRNVRLTFAFIQLLEARPDFLEDHNIFGPLMDGMRRLCVDTLAEARDRGLVADLPDDRLMAESVNLLAYLDGLAAHYMITGRNMNLDAQVDLYVDNLFTVLQSPSNGR